MSSEEPLVVKVMRLTQRGAISSSILDTLVPVQGSSSSILKFNQELVLPNSLLDVYTVTSTFDVSLTAELQGQRGDTLKSVTTHGVAQVDPSKYFQASAAFDTPLSPGPVVLVLSLTYLLTRFGDKRVLRRTYKLNLIQCISVSHRLVSFDAGSCQSLVELSVTSAVKQNVTITSLRVGKESQKETSVWSPVSLVPLISATERSINARPEIRVIRQVTNLPSVAIAEWLIPATGSQGQYSIALGYPPSPDARVSLRLAGSTNKQLVYSCGEFFNLDLLITNSSDSMQAVDLEFDIVKLRPLLIQGLAEQKVGVISPNDSLVYSLRLYPAQRGIYPLHGIRLAGQEDFYSLGEILII